ncbi:MAG: hypothetical protein Q8Q26_08915 [Pseudorhodobacter sp.]|nr:hypothetical protein [Pseudorhodobacter sp.]
MTAPASLAPDMLVGAAEIARFIFDSDEFRFQRSVYYLVTGTKRPLPHFRIGARITTRVAKQDTAQRPARRVAQ